MKKIVALIFTFIMLLALVACGKPIDQKRLPESSAVPQTKTMLSSEGVVKKEPSEQKQAESRESNMINISITAGDSIFSAKLYDNETSGALVAQFPITLDMPDLNSNEKYFYLADNLPFKISEKPATINAGDIMCWAGNCLVLFYKTFSNSYGGYVRLGYIEDVSGLAAALGKGSVQITFAVSS